MSVNDREGCREQETAKGGEGGAEREGQEGREGREGVVESTSDT